MECSKCIHYKKNHNYCEVWDDCMVSDEYNCTVCWSFKEVEYGEGKKE